MAAKRKRATKRRTYKRRKPRVTAGALEKAQRNLARYTKVGRPGDPRSLERYGASMRALRNIIDYGDATQAVVAREQMQNRMTDQYYGRGGYFNDLAKLAWKQGKKYIPRLIGAAYGGVTGSEFGPAGTALGAESGWSKGAEISRAIGWGDYATTNQIVDGPGPDSQQNIHHMGDLSGDVVYSNTEFVTNVYATITSGASPFNVESFSINAALAGTFPFLSQIAQNFELYEFQGLLFQYKPTSGEFGSNNSNALGKVILCTNYDPSAPLFVNAIQMENYDYANSTKPSCGAIHGVECHPGQRSTTQLYTRTGVSTKDPVFTDLGLFQIATEGIPSSVAQSVLIGELWVSYTVKLTRAKLYSTVGDSVLYSEIRLGETAATDLGARAIEEPLLQLGTIPFVPYSVTPRNKEFNFASVSPTSFYINFGNGWQGMKLLITIYSRPSFTSGWMVHFIPILNCDLANADGNTEFWDASQTTQRALGTACVRFNNQFVEPAQIQIATGGIAPIANQQVWIVMTVVDPQFELPVAN